MLPLMLFKMNLTSQPSVHSLILEFIPKLATHKVGFLVSVCVHDIQCRLAGGWTLVYLT